MSRTKKEKPKTGVAWESPPDADRPDWEAVADELRANPGRYMLVYQHGRYSWSSAIMQGHIRALHPDLGFEIKTSDNTRDTPRTNTMYARYNPGAEDSLAALVAEAQRSNGRNK